MGKISMMHLSLEIKTPTRIDACCIFMKIDGFESKYCSALIVLAEIASAKVLIFVLALREIETSIIHAL